MTTKSTFLADLDAMCAASPFGYVVICSVCERFAPAGPYDEFHRGQGVRHARCLPPGRSGDYDPLTDGDRYEQERQNRADCGRE